MVRVHELTAHLANPDGEQLVDVVRIAAPDLPSL